MTSCGLYGDWRTLEGVEDEVDIEFVRLVQIQMKVLWKVGNYRFLFSDVLAKIITGTKSRFFIEFSTLNLPGKSW